MPNHKFNSRRGSAILELALSTPVLAAMLIGAMDFSRLFHANVTLASAARAGAQHALSVGYADLTQVEAAAASAASDLGPVTVSATVVNRCRDRSGAAVVAGRSQMAACVSGEGTYIDVTVSKNFETMVNYGLVPNKIAASQTVSIRVE